MKGTVVFLIVLAVIGVTVIGAALGPLAWKNAVGGGSGSNDLGNDNDGTVSFSGVCGDDLAKDVGFAFDNSLNSSAEWSTSEVKIYKISSKDKTESFYKTATAGDPDSLTKVALECGAEYAYYIEGASGVISYRGVFSDLATIDGAGDARGVVRHSVPTQFGTVEARIWDYDEGAYMYDTTSDAQGEYVTSGATFTSTTDNATAKTIDTNGALDLGIHFRTNISDAYDLQFTDYKMIFSYEAADDDKWNPESASATLEGGSTVRYEDCGDVGKKLESDQNDICWELKSGDDALVVAGNTVHSVRFGLGAGDDQNPGSSDDVTLYFTTGGYFENKDGMMVAGINTDASTPAYVHSQVSYTVDVA